MRLGQIPPFSHCPTWLQASINQQRKEAPWFKCGKEGCWVCSWLKPKPPPGPCPSCGIKGYLKVHSWSKQEYSNPALPSLLRLATEDCSCPGPQTPTPITSTEPRVTLTVAGKPISFLIDTGASAYPLWKNQVLSGLCYGGLISTPRITEPLPCTLQDTPFPHSFLILPKCPTPILGRDLLSKFKASITIRSPPFDLNWLLLLNPISSSPTPLPFSSVNPIVWDIHTTHHAPIHMFQMPL